jgi:hypothetical protein
MHPDHCGFRMLCGTQLNGFEVGQISHGLNERLFLPLFCADRGFRTEGFAYGIVGFDVRTTNEINAVGHSSEDTADTRLALIVS